MTRTCRRSVIGKLAVRAGESPVVRGATTGSSMTKRAPCAAVSAPMRPSCSRTMQIGRAAWREKGEISVVAGSFKKKKKRMWRGRVLNYAVGIIFKKKRTPAILQRHVTLQFRHAGVTTKRHGHATLDAALLFEHRGA